MRAGSLRNIASRLRGVRTHLSQLIRNRTETTPSQETTHIRSDIFIYQVNQPSIQIISNKNIRITIRVCSRNRS